jgi:D-alanyl-D-alanine carboxypeptidase
VFSWRTVYPSRAKAVASVFFASAMFVSALCSQSAPAAAAPSGVVASKYAAIVVDTATGRVLYQASPDARRFPASLTKMMTLYVLFEDIERGRFRLDSRLTTSRNAAAQPPSKIGLRTGDTIRVEDAIKALVTKSANDAATVIGESVSGSIPAFADRMTRTARALGMTGTRFRNASGLPDAGQYTTARDMMKLGVALQVRFPAYYEYFKTRSFTFRGRTHGNHNNLLGRVGGVDGIKTGYIGASGFNLVSSVKRDGRKIVAVVMGGRTARGRDGHMIQLINAYLPKASRARGYDDELVAQISQVPKVAASAPHPEPVVAAAGLAGHPRPQPRPVFAPAAATPEIVTASIVPRAPADPPAVIIPLPPAAPAPARPVTMATATLPSSAAEAFADIAPVSTPEHDALGAMIEEAVGDADTAEQPVELAMAAPTKAPVAAPVAAPKAVSAPVEQAAPRRARSGWLIQIGAVESEKAAAALLKKARAKGGKSLRGAEPITEAFLKNGQTYVRARFAGFETEKSATRACAVLKKNAFACYTIRL